MAGILSFIDALSDWSGKIFSFLTIIVIVIINYEVVARYVFDAPTIWATEAMTIVCGIYFVMGGAYALLLNAHVNVDILYANFSLRSRAILDLITAPLIFLYFIVVIYTGGIYAWEAWGLKETTGTAANLPFYPLKISFFISALLMFFQMLAKFIRDFQRVVSRRESQ
jgi:TRAP-type mannitol/chloroaromatic compound transport system permease small subunit